MDQDLSFNALLEGLIYRRDLLSKKVDELLSAQEELRRVNDAIAALKGEGIPTKRTEANDDLKYNIDWKWSDKIKFALHQMGEAGTKEIASFINKMEKSDFESTYSAIAQNASKMAREGEIKAKREGKGFLYSL